jgi:hypothetical protein
MSKRKRERKALAGAAAAAGADGGRERGRFSGRRKTETILRLLRGESLDGRGARALIVNITALERNCFAVEGVEQGS